MMKHLLFVIPNYDYGGTITSLKNILPLLDKDKYKADIFAINRVGYAYEELEKYANIIGGVSYSVDKTNSKSLTNTAKIFLFQLGKMVKKFLTKINLDISPFVFKRIARKLTKNNYDIVIAYQEGQSTLLASYIKCDVRIAWQHSIFSRFVKMMNKSKYQTLLSHYDKIVCVSNTTKNDFQETLPVVKDKLVVVYNAIDAGSVKAKAAEEVIKLGDKRNIISVGRIDPVKRFSEIPSIARQVLDSGVNIDWWIVGGVADEKEYRLLIENIKKYGVINNVHIVGRLDNPYPYIAASDLLVCLSTSETFNYTIAEAKCLGVPVVTTDFDAAYEFVDNNKSGIIAPIDNLGKSIIDLLGNRYLYEQIWMNVQGDNINSNCVKEQLSVLLES